MKRAKIGLAIVAVLFIAITAFTSVAEIGPGEHAVIRRFGKVIEVRDEPGLYVGLPWGLDRVDRVAVEQSRRVVVGFSPDEDTAKLDTPVGQMLTGDQNLVNVQVVVNYSVEADRQSVVDFVLAQDQIDAILARLIENILAEWVGNRTVDAVIQNGKTELPDALVKQTQARLKEYHLGVRIRSAAINTLGPPSQVKPAFDRVAQATTEAKTALTVAQQQSNQDWSNFHAEKARTESETRSYSARTLALARAEATAYETRRVEKEKNPQVVEMNRWEYRRLLLSRLKGAGQVNPLDPKIGENRPKEMGQPP